MIEHRLILTALDVNLNAMSLMQKFFYRAMHLPCDVPGASRGIATVSRPSGCLSVREVDILRSYKLS